MTDDDLAALKSALRAAPPAPDAGKKAEHIRLAEENFARLQKSRQEKADAARPTPDRPEQTGLLKGVFAMLNSISMKGVLTATTALAAFGLVAIVVLPEGGDLLQPPMPTPLATETSADKNAQAQGRAASELLEATPRVPTEPVIREEQTSAEPEISLAQPLAEADIATESFALQDGATVGGLAGITSAPSASAPLREQRQRADSRRLQPQPAPVTPDDRVAPPRTRYRSFCQRGCEPVENRGGRTSFDIFDRR